MHTAALPSEARLHAGSSGASTPLQLAIGIVLAWAAALGAVTLVPADEHPFLR